MLKTCSRLLLALTYNLLYSVMMIKIHKIAVQIIDRNFSRRRMGKARLFFAS